MKLNYNSFKDDFYNPGFQAHAPFMNHVESSRTNMQIKYTSQVIPTKNSDNPYMVTPVANQVAQDEDQFKTYAHEDVTILYFNNDTLIYYLHETKKLKVEYVPEYKEASGASYKLYYIAKDTVRKGELIYTYAPMDIKNKIPKIGYRASVIWAPFFGFTTEDSIVISESFAKRARTIITEKIFIPISPQFRYFKQFESEGFLPEPGTYVTKDKGIYKYIPVEEGNSLESLAIDMSNNTSAIFSKTFGTKNDGYITKVKVHKIRHEEEVEAELNINQSILDELETVYNEEYKKVKDYLNNALNMLPENLRQDAIQEIIESNIFMKNLYKNNLTNKLKNIFDEINISKVDYVIELTVVSESYTQYGDKFTTMYAGKGVNGLIVPDEVMPIHPDTGKPADVWLNPLSVFGRNNWGVIFETSISKIIEDIQKYIKKDDKDAVLSRIKFLIENFYIKEFPEFKDNIDSILDEINENWNDWKQNVLENGLFIYAKAFTNFTYNEFYKLISKYEQEFNVDFTHKSKVVFKKELFGYLQSIGLDSGCIEPDGDLEAEIFASYNYILKLYHTADSKYNAASIAGKYNTNGQPIRGRSGDGNGSGGGVHYSWQTLGALMSGGATDVIKEMWTIKSDALDQKVPFMAKVIGEGEYSLKNRYTSKTKETVDVYLRMVGLKFE